MAPGDEDPAPEHRPEDEKRLTAKKCRHGVVEDLGDEVAQGFGRQRRLKQGHERRCQ